jgi:signal transduction protein with GAF and PtsI domain
MPAVPDAQSGSGLFTSSIGVAIGRPFWIDQHDLTSLAELNDRPLQPQQIPAELEKLAHGLAAAIRVLRDKQRTPDDSAFGKQRRALVDAQVLILSDSYLKAQAEARVRKGRRSAARAWVDTVLEQASLQEQADDPYLRGRAADFRELGRLVLRNLPGVSTAPAAGQLPGEPFVLVCEELSPSLLDQVRSPRLQGVLQLGGGPYSHGSILAREGLALPPSNSGKPARSLSTQEPSRSGPIRTLQRSLTCTNVVSPPRKLRPNGGRSRPAPPSPSTASPSVFWPTSTPSKTCNWPPQRAQTESACYG